MILNTKVEARPKLASYGAGSLTGLWRGRRRCASAAPWEYSVRQDRRAAHRGRRNTGSRRGFPAPAPTRPPADAGTVATPDVACAGAGRVGRPTVETPDAPLPRRRDAPAPRRTARPRPGRRARRPGRSAARRPGGAGHADRAAQGRTHAPARPLRRRPAGARPLLPAPLLQRQQGVARRRSGHAGGHRRVARAGRRRRRAHRDGRARRDGRPGPGLRRPAGAQPAPHLCVGHALRSDGAPPRLGRRPTSPPPPRAACCTSPATPTTRPRTGPPSRPTR